MRFMHTICFYQDTRHEQPLHWIRRMLDIGYIYRRNDGMTELRMNGYAQCKRVLRQLQPFIRFKKSQVDVVLKSIAILERTPVAQLTIREKKLLVTYILEIQKHNYQSQGKRTKQQLMKMFEYPRND